MGIADGNSQRDGGNARAFLGHGRRVCIRVPVDGLELDGNALCPADLQGGSFKPGVDKIPLLGKFQKISEVYHGS